MSLENVKSNIVTINVSGVTRVLNLEQVIFAVVGATTSTIRINEGASFPANMVIEGDFRNIVAGAGGSGTNAGPVFGVFTDVSSKAPVVLNFDQVTRWVNGGDIKFSHYGTVAAFTYNMLESIQDVVGGTGHSLQDIGIFSVNQTGNTILPPVQSAAGHASSGGTIPNDTYFLVVTALNPSGETTVSNEVSVTTTGTGESTITANWALSTGATSGYRVYIGTVSGAENKFLDVPAGSTTVTILSLGSLDSGAPPTSNTAVDTTLNVQEYINVKNVTHQVPSGTNWTTTFTDASSVLYVESLQDLVGG